MIWLLIALNILLTVGLVGAVLFIRAEHQDFKDAVERADRAKSQSHAFCLATINASVSRAHAADVLEDAAHRWDAVEEQGHLKVLAREHYVPGGPSMPAIWMRDRAAMLRGEREDDGITERAFGA
jgi:hypothetical protein